MSNFYKDTMNIPIVGAEYGFNGVVDPEYARGHRAALIAASKIALDADVRVNSLETDLAAANAEITRLREGGCARDQHTTQYCGEAQRLAEALSRLQNLSIKKTDDAKLWFYTANESEASYLQDTLREVLVAIEDIDLPAQKELANKVTAKLNSLTICTGALSANAHLWREIDSQSNTASRTDVQCERCGVYGEMEYATMDVTFPTT